MPALRSAQLPGVARAPPGARGLPSAPRRAGTARRGDDQHLDVGVVELLHESDARRDQAGAAEQHETGRRQPRRGLRGRLLERPHRRMQRGRAPEHVVGDPARVVDELVVVRLVEQRVRVGRVGREQRRDAADQEIEGGCSLARVDGQPDRCREQQDVAERIGGRHGFREVGKTRDVDVGRDQEHPRQQTDPDREDERVDQPDRSRRVFRRRTSRIRPAIRAG